MRLRLGIAAVAGVATLVSWGLVGCNHGAGFRGGKGKVSFEREIKPILARNCVKCHSGGRKSPRGGPAPDFRTREAALADFCQILFSLNEFAYAF